MTGRLRTSRAGLELIKSFEGFREIAVRMPDGRWTIGHGHVRTAREGLTISDQDADDLLAQDLTPVETALHSLVFTPLNQNQFDALASLVFNISVAQFGDSAVLRYLNAGDFLNAANAFDLWRKARIDGRIMVVDALVRRRAAEKAMFLEHPNGRPTAPTPLVTPEQDLGPGGDQSGFLKSSPATQSYASASNDSEASQGGASPSIDMAEAVRRLAERTNGFAAAAGDSAAEHVAEEPVAEDEPETERRPPPRSASEIEVVRRAVADRISRILERTERAIDEQEPAAPPAASPTQVPEPTVPSRSAAVAPPKSRPATSDAVSDEAGRKIIDDTETFDPGRDPSTIFAEAEHNAKIVNGRSQRLGLFNGRLVTLAPWAAILVLSLLGFSIGLVDAVQDTGVAPGASTILAVFGMLVLMSAYFILTRASERDL